MGVPSPSPAATARLDEFGCYTPRLRSGAHRSSGSGQERPTEGPDFSRRPIPSFSPDGETVVFSRTAIPVQSRGRLGPLHDPGRRAACPLQLTNTPDLRRDTTGMVTRRHKDRVHRDRDQLRPIPAGHLRDECRRHRRQQLDHGCGERPEPSWRGAAAGCRASRVRRARRRFRCRSCPPTRSARRRTARTVRRWRSARAVLRRGIRISTTSPNSATFGTRQRVSVELDWPSAARRRSRAISSTAADEANVQIDVKLTDVRKRDDPAADYETNLRVLLDAQLTDRDAGCCGVPAPWRTTYSWTSRLRAHRVLIPESEARALPRPPPTRSFPASSARACAPYGSCASRRGLRQRWASGGRARASSSPKPLSS